MGWSFRKSRKFGPFRLTVSKRGVGWSVGGGGLRFGSGSRGSYVSASKFGFTYREKLGGGSKRRRANSRAVMVRRTGFFYHLWRGIKLCILLLLLFLALLWFIGFMVSR